MGKNRGESPLAQKKPHRLKNQVLSVWLPNEVAEWLRAHLSMARETVFHEAIFP